MRTHAQILVEAGGPATVSRELEVPVGVAKGWKRNGSIPGPYWAAIVRKGFASFEELAAAAEARRSNDNADPAGANP